MTALERKAYWVIIVYGFIIIYTVYYTLSDSKEKESPSTNSKKKEIVTHLKKEHIYTIWRYGYQQGNSRTMRYVIDHESMEVGFFKDSIEIMAVIDSLQ